MSTTRRAIGAVVGDIGRRGLFTGTVRREPAARATPAVVATPTIRQPDPAAPSPRSAIVLDPVDTDWTRTIEQAIGGRDVSVAVGTGHRILFVHSGGVRRIPASNQKLLTSMAALDTFGPDRRFTTVAASRTPPSGGVIRGDLWVAPPSPSAVPPISTLPSTSLPWARC